MADRLIYSLPILFIIIFSFTKISKVKYYVFPYFKKRSGKEKQGYLFICFFLIFLLKSFCYLFVSDILSTPTRFIINNAVRMMQFSLILYLVVFVIYKDRRSIIPIIILSSISVFYFISNIYILLGSWIVQNILFNFKYFLGSIAILSLVDLGFNQYERLFNTSFFLNNKLISYVSAILPIQTHKKIETT